MNIISSKIIPGLANWKKLGGKLDFLKSSSIGVPRIFIASKRPSNELVIIVSGFHLEETSGPLLLLNPDKVLPILNLGPAYANFLIYPVINQFGLKFSIDSHENLLRSNHLGINYNDKWGMLGKKTEEVSLIESDILKMVKKYSPIFALSLHEDSVTPGKGYLWFNGIKSREVRKKIITEVKSVVEKSLALEIQEPEVEGGKIEDGFAIVDAKDKGTFENWLSDDLKIPVVLSEAPFGLKLNVREQFHQVVMKSAINVLV